MLNDIQLKQLEAIRKRMLLRKKNRHDGGEGSGNWGHEGRPGKVGGSAEGGGTHNRETTESGGYTSFAKKKAQAMQNHRPTHDELKNLSAGCVIFDSTGTKWTVDKDKWGDILMTNQDTGEVLEPGFASDRKAFINGNESIRVLIPDTEKKTYQVSKTTKAFRGRFEKAFSPAEKADFDARYRGQSGRVWSESTEEQKDAVYAYTSSGYRKINRNLRNGTPENDPRIKEMAEMVGRSEFASDTNLFRGTSVNALELMFGLPSGTISDDNFKNIIGMEGVEKGFSSCGSVKKSGFSDKDVIFEIMAPKGTKGLYVEPISALGNGPGRDWDGKKKQSSYSSEFETILQCGTRFKCFDAYRKGFQYVFRLAVTDQTPEI